MKYIITDEYSKKTHALDTSEKAEKRFEELVRQYVKVWYYLHKMDDGYQIWETGKRLIRNFGLLK